MRCEGDRPARGVLDRVRLEPLELIEETQVASVLVDASVIDRNGRSIATLKTADFTLFEDGTQQTLDLVQLQRVPTQFTLLVDGSQSMSRRIDLVHATARRITSRLRLGDMVTVAPFRREGETMTGPTTDEASTGEDT